MKEVKESKGLHGPAAAFRELSMIAAELSSYARTMQTIPSAFPPETMGAILNDMSLRTSDAVEKIANVSQELHDYTTNKVVERSDNSDA